MMSLRKSVLTTKDTKRTKFGVLFIRTLRVLRDLRGENSFSLGCALAVLGAFMLPVNGSAQSLCVRLISDRGIERSAPVRLGSTLRLSFRHSIYGSQIEEVFALRRAGFELIQLRYGEARLVDFYGYENAEQEHGLWVVTPAPALLPSLNLMLSADASMSLHFDRHANSKQLVIQPGSALRLTVATCENSADD